MVASFRNQYLLLTDICILQTPERVYCLTTIAYMLLLQCVILIPLPVYL